MHQLWHGSDQSPTNRNWPAWHQHRPRQNIQLLLASLVYCKRPTRQFYLAAEIAHSDLLSHRRRLPPLPPVFSRLLEYKPSKPPLLYVPSSPVMNHRTLECPSPSGPIKV